MTGGDKKNYSLFTGCLIPSKFPFIEVASRKVLEGLGLTIHEIEGHSCCPNQMAIQAADKELWYTIAARNLALAERNGWDIVSLCNGCYDTLKTVNSKLKVDEAFRERINGTLEDYGLEFKGTIDVKHVVQVLHDDVGLNTIDKAVTVPLDRFRFSPFVGCHVKRPGDHMGFDDPEDPYYLQDILRAIGAKVLEYSEQNSCCSGGFSIARGNDVVPAARRVLRSIKDVESDALVVNCPYCFAQLFGGERKVKEIYFEGMDLPIFYFTQLIGLAMGFDPDEMALPLHYDISVGGEKALVANIRGERPDDSYMTGQVTRAQLETCHRCLACTDDCPTAMTAPEYDPAEIIEMILDGHIGEVLERKDFWYCINCHECIEHCPQGFGMVKLWVMLKNMAVAKGIRPEVVTHRLEELAETGYSFAPDEEKRQTCGLECISAPDTDEINRILKEASRVSK
jgi:heterodisulfide reductase subunit B